MQASKYDIVARRALVRYRKEEFLIERRCPELEI